MFDVSIAFKTATRDALVDVALAIARVIPDNIQSPEVSPFVIQLDGDADSGKSLFWDEIKDSLLWDGGRINYGYTESIYEDDCNYRVYESWEGISARTRKPLRVFFCNLDSLFLKIEDNRDVENKILRFSPVIKKEMGDIIILSNAKRTLPFSDIEIGLRIAEHRTRNWFRQTEISFRSPAINSFMNTPLLGRP